MINLADWRPDDVVPVPGPPAPITALAVSGLPTDSFLYLGYLPSKTSDRPKAVEQVANLSYTLIFFESPHRIVESLEDLLSILGDRRHLRCPRNDQLFEEYWRGTMSGAVEYFKSQPVPGEFTLVIEGKQKEERSQWTEAELWAAIEKELQSEKSAKDISVELAEQSGWNKKEIYSLINRKK